MFKSDRLKKLPPTKEIAYIAVMCAILIGGQYVFSFIAGVEIVTLLFICFAFVFGARAGVICAVSFSLLRCVLFGFYPTAVILYLIYYPLLCAAFGCLGRIKDETFENYPISFAVAVNALLLGIAAACALCYGFNVIKISRIYKITLNVLLWVIFGLCTLLFIAFNALFIAKKAGKDTSVFLKLVTVTSIAAAFTVCFTLLDDIITPLFWGYTRATALAYFYSSFTAMLPQTVCTVVTVSTLFLPLTKVMKRAI